MRSTHCVKMLYPPCGQHYWYSVSPEHEKCILQNYILKNNRAVRKIGLRKTIQSLYTSKTGTLSKIIIINLGDNMNSLGSHLRVL